MYYPASNSAFNCNVGISINDYSDYLNQHAAKSHETHDMQLSYEIKHVLCISNSGNFVARWVFVNLE